MYHQRGIACHTAVTRLYAGVGETLFNRRDPCRQGFEIRRGVVRAVNHSREGHRQIMAFFFAGDMIGVPIRKEQRYTCEAATDVHYVPHIPTTGNKADVHDLEQVGGLLANIWREEKSFMARGLILGRASVSARLAAFLIVAAPRLTPKDGGLDFPFSQGDIASYLGTTPETICRAMRQLREMNIIAMPIRGCLAVRSFDALKAIADGID